MHKLTYCAYYTVNKEPEMDKIIIELEKIKKKFNAYIFNLCARFPEHSKRINFFITKEAILNSYIYSFDEHEAFQELLLAMQQAQKEYDEIKK